jgi:hypothetical protein
VGQRAKERETEEKNIELRFLFLQYVQKYLPIYYTELKEARLRIS